MAASDVRAGGAFVELYTKDAAFQKGLEAATRRLKAWGASVTAVGASIGAIGASIMAPMAAHDLKATAYHETMTATPGTIGARHRRA